MLDRWLDRFEYRAIEAWLRTARTWDDCSPVASDPKSLERGILQDLFDPVAVGAINLLKMAMPDRSTAEIVWGFQMIIGTMIYIMADVGRAKMLSSGACDPADVDATLRHIVPLLLNGIYGERRPA